MRERDLVGMITDIMNSGRQMPGQYLGSTMPMMTRFHFGDNSPAAVYGMGAPRVPRGIMGQPQPATMPEPVPESPIEMRRAAGTDVARGTIPYRPSPDAEIPPYRPIPLPPERPAPASLGNDTIGFGSYGENVVPTKAGFDMKGTGAKLGAIGGGGSSRGQGESMYAPAPSIVSPGMAGSGGGRDVDLTKYLRGLLMRRG